ncbi:hypothetical protein ZTR_02622 [Talaromyces verruculosus]|nr:hypothetical protein ZTR_02622 [Talaromyces verruculosus]
MRLIQLLAALVAATVTAASPVDLTERSCSGGKEWGDNKNSAIDHAGHWCSGKGGSGSYSIGQTKYGCYNLPFGKNKVEFWIQNKMTTPSSLSSSQCDAYMQEQINNCVRGGSGERNGWYFRADVNGGQC